MKVGVITSHDLGYASYAVLRLLNEATDFELHTVFLNTGSLPKNKKWWVKKISKTYRIGFLGACCGVWMRRWYLRDTVNLLMLDSLRSISQAHEFNLNLVQVNGLNVEPMRSAIKSSGVDLVISLGNGFISSSVFSIPKYGMLNVHHEQLPTFRNAQSVIWQLYCGNRITGYTIHEITRTIDGGRIFFQEEVPILFEDSLPCTVTKTYAMLWRKSTDGLIEVLNDFDRFLAEAVDQSGDSGHFTTPSLRQFLRIWINWRYLKRLCVRR